MILKVNEIMERNKNITRDGVFLKKHRPYYVLSLSPLIKFEQTIVSPIVCSTLVEFILVFPAKMDHV